jgi:phage/plasmid-associated DNA primase
LAHGLAAPATVRNATDEYFREQDLLLQWIEERCIVGFSRTAPSS